MKRITNAAALLWMAAASAFASGVADEDTKTRSKASGSIVSETRELPRFESIKLTGSGFVRFRIADAFRVTVSARESLMSRVSTDVSGPVLELGLRPGFSIRGADEIEYLVEAPALSGIEVSGSGAFAADSPLSGGAVTVSISGSGAISAGIDADKVFVRIGGSGRIQADVDAAKVDAGIGGSGSIRLSGSADSLSFDGSGSGALMAKNLSTKSAEILVSGSGSAEIGASDRLRVRISGAGGVAYRGRPLLDYASSGTGRIVSLD